MILIAVPTYESIAPECFKAIYDLKGDDLVFEYVKGYDCAKARNDIAKRALEGAFDYVLMVDSDVVIPDDTLEKMMEFPADICLGVYPRKNGSHEAELFKPGTFSFEERFKLSELTEPRIKIKGGGLGCALVNTRVFKQLPYPWFVYECYDNGVILSEDLYFCMMAEDFTIEADTRVRCGHITKDVLYE